MTRDQALTRDQLMMMLQTLLEGRFKLKYHRETRQLPILSRLLEQDNHINSPSAAQRNRR